MVPLVTYVIFNVDFMWISLINIISLLLSLISFIVHFNANSDANGEEIAIIVILYFQFLVAITIISGFIGYWLDRTERKQFKLMATIEQKID